MRDSTRTATERRGYNAARVARVLTTDDTDVRRMTKTRSLPANDANERDKKAQGTAVSQPPKFQLGAMDAVGFWSSTAPHRRGGLPLIPVNPRDSRAER